LYQASARRALSARRHHLVADPTERDPRVFASYQAWREDYGCLLETQGAGRGLPANEEGENTMFMIRLCALARPCVLLLAIAGAALAQENPAPAAEELAKLRGLIEQQSKQIETLTKEIAELKQRMPPKPRVRLFNEPPAPAEPPTPTAPAPAETAPAASAPESVSVPAEAGVKHTVAKGETLTSIAKRYNIPLAELEKVNKIENDRALQIGRVLNIPLPATKTPEPPKESQKENP
jgi:LysM repeat protein